MLEDLGHRWGLSKRGTALVLLILVASLGWIVSEEITQAPIAQRELQELARENALLGPPPPGGTLLKCRHSSAPRKAMIACVYSLTSTPEGVGPYYDGALGRLGWFRCSGTNGAVAPIDDRQYCKGTLRVLLDQQVSGAGRATGYHLDFFWGLGT